MKYNQAMMDSSIAEIQGFAKAAHAGQLRKYTGDPYILHPIAVARMVANLDCGGQLREMIASALLHDVLEDTEITETQLYDFLISVNGFEEWQAGRIHMMVCELTDFFTKENYPNLNRAERKHLEAKSCAGWSYGAKTIKRCDLAHNAISIEANDPGFYSVFSKERDAILGFMNGVVE